MSAQGDHRFYSTVQEKLGEAIDNLMEQLVNQPTDKAAGRIKGLRDALDIMREVYTKQTTEDRPH